MEKNLLIHHGNLWQHPLWATFQQSIGRQVWMLDVQVASALVVRHPLPLGLCWLEVPRGPLFEDETGLENILEEIKRLGKKEKAVFVRFSSYKNLPTLRFTLYAASGDHHPETSLLLDLNLSEEALLQQMKPKGRYNIKVAQKHGVIVEASEDVESFHSILQKTGGRDGFGIHPQRYYQKMLEHLGDHAQLLLAKHDGYVIAGGIFVYLNDTAIYYYGASDHDHRHLMAPYLIQWTAIQEAKKRGFKTYDFLGIAPEDAQDHPWAGVTSFKKKFGGQVVNYPQAKNMVFKRFWYLVYRMRKRFF